MRRDADFRRQRACCVASHFGEENASRRSVTFVLSITAAVKKIKKKRTRKREKPKTTRRRPRNAAPKREKSGVGATGKGKKDRCVKLLFCASLRELATLSRKNGAGTDATFTRRRSWAGRRRRVRRERFRRRVARSLFCCFPKRLGRRGRRFASRF